MLWQANGGNYDNAASVALWYLGCVVKLLVMACLCQFRPVVRVHFVRSCLRGTNALPFFLA